MGVCLHFRECACGGTGWISYPGIGRRAIVCTAEKHRPLNVPCWKWEEAGRPKTANEYLGFKPRHMSYDDVFQVITKYAHEMQRHFADKFSRFPEGGNAAMIVKYLNDKADFYRTIDENIANDLVDAADEIIFRCG